MNCKKKYTVSTVYNPITLCKLVWNYNEAFHCDNSSRSAFFS